MKLTSWLVRSMLLASLSVAFLARAAETGVSDKEMLIGQFAAQSGPAAQPGKRMQLGIAAPFNAVNAAPGLSGQMLELVPRDGGYEPEKALRPQQP